MPLSTSSAFIICFIAPAFSAPVDRGGIPANNFWPFVGDSNRLWKGVSVLERVHSNSAYDFYFYFFISLFFFYLTLMDPGMQAGHSRPHPDGTADCIRS